MPLRATLLACAIASSGAIVSTQTPPACRIDVHNPVAVAREQWVLASVPFARGEYRCQQRTLVDVVIGDRTTVAPAVPLIRWEDGSVCVLQAHLWLAVPALGSLSVTVRPRVDVDVADAAFPRHAPMALPSTLPITTEVEDPWGRRHQAQWSLDTTVAPDGVVSDSGAVRTIALCAMHRLVDGNDAGAPFLGLRGFLTTFHGERRAELTLLLDNAELTPALGPVRCRSFALSTHDKSLRFLPAFAEANALPPPAPTADGYRQWLLPPSDQHYLGDGTAKAFRLHLYQDGEGVTDAQRTAAAFAEHRLLAFPDLDRVRATGAFGAHGGPAPRDAGDEGTAGDLYRGWQFGPHFGPFGSFGDPNGIGQQSPRQGDSALHNVLRWRSPHLLRIAEAMLLQHPLRPTPGPKPLPADTAPLRQGLGPRALRTPHGFAAIDYEHVSALLLYDAYWLTGDPLARSELQRLGRALRTLLPAVPFRTCRGEGQCLQSGVLIARATDDASLRAYLLEHCRTQLLPQLRHDGGACLLPQPMHRAVMDEDFDAPWQMAQLLRGLCALYAATGDSALAAAVRQTAGVMAGQGWIEGEGPKSFVSATDARRYTIAADPVDRQGEKRMILGAFVMAAEVGNDPAETQLWAARAAFLLASDLPPDATLDVVRAAAANPWLQVALDRRERTR